MSSETPPLSEQAREILGQMLAMPFDRRRHFIATVCTDDEALRRELDALLRRYEDGAVLPGDSQPGAPRDPYQLIGHTVSHYRVLEKLGGGGMGVVYKARDLRLQRTVAMKFLPPELTRDEEARNRFVREAQAASALDHPNICTIHEIDETAGRTFIVMSYYAGETLKARIARGRLPLGEAVDYALQIAHGLARAHEAGIIHRDIKPANVMITDRGRAILLDFGLAKVQSVELTQRGTTLGTAAYMSPEQTRGEEVHHQADIWSLGVVLFEMITGERPFRGDYAQALVYAVLHEPPASLTLIDASLPVTLERIIRRCLKKDPSSRYARVQDFVDDLRALSLPDDAGRTYSGPPAVRSHAQAERAPVVLRHARRVTAHSRRRMALVAAGFLVLAAFLAMLTWWRPGGSSRIRSMAVLPCSTQGVEAVIAYHCDLLAESLIARMSQIPGLIVLSYPIVEPYKGSTKSILDIGRELGVDAVFTAVVDTQMGELQFRMRVTDVRTGAHVWGDRIESPATTVRGLHEAIALEVAEHLKLLLSEREKARFNVYSTYQQALYYWNRRTSESLLQARDLFEEVRRMDPTFARAYEGLANTYVLLPYYSGMSPEEAYPQAREAAEHALRLDETLADAHAALGLVLRDYERNWAGARLEFDRAIQLSPASGSAFQYYAEYLTIMGEFDAAIQRIEEAEEKSPLSLTMRAVHGWILMCAERFEEAHAQLEATLEMDPEFPLTHWFLGQLYARQEQYDLATEALENAVQLSDASSRMVADLGSVYARKGDTAQAQVYLEQLRLRSKEGLHVSGYEYAVIYAGLGAWDRALTALEAAFEERSWQVVNMAVDPMLYPLRGDPRFIALVRRLGIPGHQD